MGNLQEFPESLADAVWIESTRRAMDPSSRPMTKGEFTKMTRELLAPLLTEAPPPEKKVRPRNPLIDALATLNGAVLAEVSPMMFSQCAKALADIKAATPGVTAEEIQKRAARYRTMFPRITISCTALAKWWGDCGENAQAPAVQKKPTNYGAI